MANNKTQSPLALLGGSFDPIHYGHIKPALEAAKQLNINEIHLLPNRVSPLKQHSTVNERHKLQMLKLVVAQYGQFQIDARELTQPQPNYTINTLKSIRAEIGDRPLCFIMGYDSLASLPRWYQWQQLLDYAHLVVSRRPDQNLNLPTEVRTLLSKVTSNRIASSQGSIICLNTQALPISSTLIRHNIKKGLSVKELMPDCITTYIKENQLYLQAK